MEGGILVLLSQDGVADDEQVELGAHEAAEGVLRRAHDRLAPHVEAGVDHHRTACQPVKTADELVIDRVGLAVHGLHSC